jgi:hypothetical protein
MSFELCGGQFIGNSRRGKAEFSQPELDLPRWPCQNPLPLFVGTKKFQENIPEF